MKNIVDRVEFYEYGKPKERTKKRLTEIVDLGMEETGIASFGDELIKNLKN